MGQRLFYPPGGGGAEILRGTLAARPAAGVAGRLYLATDAPYMYFDSGAAWFKQGLVQSFDGVPAFGGFRVVAAGGRATTFTTFADGLLLRATNLVAVSDARLAVMAAPAEPWTLTAHLTGIMEPQDFSTAGICIRDTVSGRVLSWSCHPDNTGFGFGINAIQWDASDATDAPVTIALSSQPFVRATAGPWAGGLSGLWLKVINNGIDLIFSFSPDGGVTYITLYSQPVGTWLANNRGEVGLITTNIGGLAVEGGMLCEHFVVG